MTREKFTLIVKEERHEYNPYDGTIEIIVDKETAYVVNALNADQANGLAHDVAMQYVADEYGLYHINRAGEITGRKCFDYKDYIHVMPFMHDIYVTWEVIEEKD